jgi:hypothetical protein
MAITSLDQYIAASKQRVRILKTATRTSLAATPFSVFDIAGDPGAGTLAGTSTSAGVVPTDATAGCPNILFSSGTGYLSKVEFANTVASRLAIFDMVYKAGAYSYAGGTTTLSSQPSILGRSPDGTGQGFEFWLEVSTAFATGTAWQVQLTYTNSAGVTGRTSVITAALAAASLTQGRLLPIALQSGDTGIQKLESVIVTNGGTAMTAGAFNILVLRPLWTQGRIITANWGDIHDLLKTGMPVVYTDSAMYLMVTADSTSTGLPELTLEIASA